MAITESHDDSVVTMPPRRKNKLVPKPKQQRRVNWLELPSDIMLNILKRVGVFDVLQNAQKVCTAWCQICKDPAMWRVVHMNRLSGHKRSVWQEMCKRVVDRSQGQLLDLTIIGFCHQRIFQYVADRSSQLRRLEVVFWLWDCHEIPSELFKKLPSVEELSLVRTPIGKENIETIGRYCPLLKTLKVNQEAIRIYFNHDSETIHNEVAVAIGANLPGLTHLELIGNSLQNIGLHAILDGCCHLESLDLRGCKYLDLKGKLGKRCSLKIKHLRLPHESLEDWVYNDE